MSIRSIWRKFRSKSEKGTLVELSIKFGKIKDKVEAAKKRREKIFDKIWASCEKLKNNPIDLKERRRLRWYLHVEGRFLEAVRKGIKDGLKILESTLNEIYKAKINPEFKAKALQDVQFAIDAMQFAKGKIKVIENRVKIGERLVSRDDISDHLDKFLQTMGEEKELDGELELVLVGKSKKVRSKLNILKYVKKVKSVEAGVGIAIGGGAAYGGVIHYVKSDFIPTDATAEPIFLIIATAIAFMLSISAETHLNEESHREG